DRFHLDVAFWGSEEATAARQRRYVANFVDRPGPVVDIGCGRGEFLELLQAEEIDVVGVDSGPALIDHCRTKGLAVQLDDGLAFLDGLRDSSLGGGFSSHLIGELEPGTCLEV